MPSAKARDFQRVAVLLGFILKRTSGSHQQWEHPDGRLLTIPVHGSREIGPPLFFKILRQLDVTLEQFQKMR
jgi:predicted RNA binding protein YcfA (HicA-like mRNA interferase family)